MDQNRLATAYGKWPQSSRNPQTRELQFCGGGGEETENMSNSTDLQGNTTVSSIVHQSQSLLHNIRRPRNNHSMATQPFGSIKETTLVVDYLSDMLCCPVYISMTHHNYNLYGECCGPTQYHNGPPPIHGHVSNLPNMLRNFHFPHLVALWDPALVTPNMGSENYEAY